MKKVLSLVLVIFMLVAVVSCSKSDSSSTTASKDTLQTILEEGKMVVGVRCRFAPIGLVNAETGELEGMVIDLIKLYADKLGVEIEFKDVEWSALIPGLMNGDFDCLACHMTRTVARTASIGLSDPYILTGTVGVIRADSNIKTWADVNNSNVKIGITEGNVYIDVIEKQFPNAQMVTFSGKSEWTEALKMGRIDLVLDGEFAGLEMMEVYPGSFKILPDGYLDTETYALCTRYGDWGFLRSFNVFLQEVKTNGEYQAIYEKWIGQEWNPSSDATSI